MSLVGGTIYLANTICGMMTNLHVMCRAYSLALTKSEIRNCSSYTMLHFETYCIRILITASCCSRTSTLEQMKTALASETISNSLAAFSVSQYAFSAIFCLSRQVDGSGFMKETSEPIKWSSNQGMLSMLEVGNKHQTVVKKKLLAKCFRNIRAQVLR